MDDREDKIFCLGVHLREFYVEFGQECLREKWVWGEESSETKKFIYPDELAHMFKEMEDEARYNTSIEGDFNIAVSMKILIEGLSGPGITDVPINSDLNIWLDLTYVLAVCYGYEDMFTMNEMVRLYRKLLKIPDGEYIPVEEIVTRYKRECTDARYSFSTCLEIDCQELVRRKAAGHILKGDPSSPHLNKPLFLEMDSATRKIIIDNRPRNNPQ